MIKNVIFDYGAVLVDWNPHYIYDPYFSSSEKADWFLGNVCTFEWNTKQDAGRPVREAEAELIGRFPEWEKEIKMYYSMTSTAVKSEIPGMYELLTRLKAKGIHLYGLSNWSAETFPVARAKFHIFDLMENMVISGEEHLVKPQPEIFRLALKRFGINPAETVFVDDLQRNVDGACAVGIQGKLFKGVDDLAGYLGLD